MVGTVGAGVPGDGRSARAVLSGGGRASPSPQQAHGGWPLRLLFAGCLLAALPRVVMPMSGKQPVAVHSVASQRCLANVRYENHARFAPFLEDFKGRILLWDVATTGEAGSGLGWGAGLAGCPGAGCVCVALGLPRVRARTCALD